MPSKTYISVPKSPSRSAQLFSCKHVSSCRLPEKATTCAAGSIRLPVLSLRSWLVVGAFFAFSHENENESGQCRRNQRNHRNEDRMPMLQDDREYMPSITGGQERQEGISDNSAERQCKEKFLHGMLHRAGGKHEGNHGRRRRQQSDDGDGPKTPSLEYAVNFLERPGWEFALERFFPSFASKVVRGVASHH